MTGCTEQMSQAERLVNVHLMEKDSRGLLEEVGTDSTGGEAKALGWWTLDLMKPLREVHFKTKGSDRELGRGKE